MNSKIGTVILKRVAKIVYPNKRKETNITIPAIRSGVIQSLYIGEGKINLISFLKYYPNKTMAIDLTLLNDAVYKAESMSDLVEFFSNGPLEKLKNPTSES